MFSVNRRDDALESLELRDSDAKGLLVLAPRRGGMATRLALGGSHLFFLDEATLRDETKNVRGGNPVLFPSPGKLTDDRWQHGTLKQHGFARTSVWEEVATDTTNDARATLRLRATDATRSAYPWDFTADYTYVLGGSKLRVEMAFTNQSSEPMPFGAGFHPYFHVKSSDKARTRVVTGATRAWDNVAKTEGVLDGIDLTRSEVDLHLLDHGNAPCTLETPGRRVELRGSPEFTHWVVWTVAGKDFVCVEPWTCPGDALRTGDRLLTLPAGASRTLWVEYSLRPE